VTGPAFTIFLVDDDPGVLDALENVLRASGHQVKTFLSPQQFLGEHDPSVPGCAIFDVSMPGLDGLQLQEALRSDGVQRPVIFITGVGDIPIGIRAMKAGAVDFLTKPVNRQQLLAAIAQAAEKDAKARDIHKELASIKARLETLTPREYEVFASLVRGRVNKQIAYELGVSHKTIKVHRARVMSKLGARSMVELVRLAEQAGMTSDRTPTEAP
jgi:FixJ family two-component response regulator